MQHKSEGVMLEWLKRHAWKACIRQKRIPSSNLGRSAKKIPQAILPAGFFFTYMMIKPTLYIIAGCNGAGKTTASYSVLPDLLNCREFVNADEIAKGLSPFNPESVAIEAGRLMLQRINLLLSQGKTFALETTLATRSYATLVKRAKAEGYQVLLVFFWLATPEMAIERVAKRVSEGGHNIPTPTIIRRYWLGLQNFFNIFAPIVDGWMFFNNVGSTILLATEESVINKELFTKIRESCQNKKKEI